MVAGVAARQHGVVARRQLLALGLGRSAIQGRIDAGRLHRVHSGVYAVGHPIVSDRGRYLAAALACGPGAVVSYRSAAVLWAIAPEIEGPIHVTVGRGSHRRVGLVVHRARHLTDDQRGRIDSIPVTAIPRTLLDLASTMTPSALRRAFEESDRLGLLDHSALSRLLLITSGRRGTGRLARLLAEHRPLPATRSALERRFLRLCHS